MLFILHNIAISTRRILSLSTEFLELNKGLIFSQKEWNKLEWKFNLKSNRFLVKQRGLESCVKNNSVLLTLQLLYLREIVQRFCLLFSFSCFSYDKSIKVWPASSFTLFFYFYLYLRPQCVLLWYLGVLKGG